VCRRAGFILQRSFNRRKARTFYVQYHNSCIVSFAARLVLTWPLRPKRTVHLEWAMSNNSLGSFVPSAHKYIVINCSIMH